MTLSYLDAGDSRSVTRDKMNALFEEVGLSTSVNTTQATEYFNTLVLDMLDPPLLPIEHGMVGTIARERINAAIDVVNAGVMPVITGTVTVSGGTVVGNTLTATVPTYTGTGVESWEWLRDGGPIVGATSSTYTLVDADAGAMIVARFTVENIFGGDSADSIPVGPVLTVVDAYWARVTSGARWGFNDLSVLFTTDVGEVNTSSAGDSIGLLLDNREWGGLSLSEVLAAAPNIIEDSGFDDPSKWTAGTGITVEDGFAKFNTTETQTLTQARTINRAVRHFMSCDLSNRVAGQITLRFGNGGIALTFTSNGHKEAHGVTAQGSNGVFNAFGGNLSIYLDNWICKEIPGRGLTSTGAARGTYQTGGICRMATDDYLQAYTFTPQIFIMARAKLTGGSGTRAIAGASGNATARGNLYFTSGGQAACRIGDGDEITVSGDRTGVDGTCGYRVRTADGEVDLVVDGVVVATEALSGAITTTVDFTLGAINNNGTRANFFTGDFITGAGGDSVITGNAVPTDAELLALHNYLMAA